MDFIILYINNNPNCIQIFFDMFFRGSFRKGTNLRQDEQYGMGSFTKGLEVVRKYKDNIPEIKEHKVGSNRKRFSSKI